MRSFGSGVGERPPHLDQSAGAAASKGDMSLKVLTSSDPAHRRKKLAAESASGRLTVLAIVGMFFPDGLTGRSRGSSTGRLREPGARRSSIPARLACLDGRRSRLASILFLLNLGSAVAVSAQFAERPHAAVSSNGRIAMMAIIGMFFQVGCGHLQGAGRRLIFGGVSLDQPAGTAA